jgi:hypothetical protein
MVAPRNAFSYRAGGEMMLGWQLRNMAHDDPIRIAIGPAHVRDNPVLLRMHKIFSCGFTRMFYPETRWF